MKIGDTVYLITDQLQAGAGIPGMICALQDSTVEVVVEFSQGTKILKLCNWEDILPSNLYTHSILNVVYHTYGEIEHKYGSILKLTTEEIVAQLVQQGLAPQTACCCADLFDEVEWHNAQLPLRRRCFSGGKRPVFGCALAARSAGSRAHARGTRTCVDTRGTRPGNWFVARCIRSHFQCLKDSRLPKKSGSRLRCFVELLGVGIRRDRRHARSIFL